MVGEIIKVIGLGFIWGVGLPIGIALAGLVNLLLYIAVFNIAQKFLD